MLPPIISEVLIKFLTGGYEDMASGKGSARPKEPCQTGGWDPGTCTPAIADVGFPAIWTTKSSSHSCLTRDHCRLLNHISNPSSEADTC